ncbi:MAG: VWA domain-containing protein [Pseudomonadota bacterium]
MTDDWDRACLCAVLGLARPDLFGGVIIRSGQGPVLEAWMAQVGDLLAETASPIIVPSSVPESRLHRALSVARSLRDGRPIYQSGLLEDAAGRVMIVQGAERLRSGVATAIAITLDESRRALDEAVAVLAIDEGRDPGETVPKGLAERLAFRADLNALRLQDVLGLGFESRDVSRVRRHIHDATVADDDLTSIAAACLSLGITSMRVPIFCMHAAQGLAALERREAVQPDDITRACQLILPGRGRPVVDPQSTPPDRPDQAHPPDANDDSGASQPESETSDTGGGAMEAQIIAAMDSAPVTLMALPSKRQVRDRSGVSGRSGAHVIAFDRGRPDRPVRGQFGHGRIDVLASLRAAAPMQRAREEAGSESGLKIRKSDLRVKRFKRRKQSSVIFVVDASGSAAMHRMAEAKGAVERLLSQCYARRDLVSLISFAGDHATPMLPPSRSLVRARRQISDLAGGGATPLAHALVEAFQLARAEQDRGRTPFLVFLTDGRGNMTLEGEADRRASQAQVSRLARTLIKDRFAAVFFDTSRRPDPRGRALSADLGAQYQFLPNADGETVSRVVRQRIGSR